MGAGATIVTDCLDEDARTEEEQEEEENGTDDGWTDMLPILFTVLYI